jgi:hypothetical protein
VDGDFSFGFVVATDDDEGAQPQAVYSVFSREGSESDQPAKSWAEGEHPGLDLTILKDDARLLLGGAGLDGEDLVGAPTTDGAVCVAIVPGGSGSCGKWMDFGLQVNGEQRDGRMLVYGLVADEVQGVEVVASGHRRHARMGENAYACELPGGAELEEVVLRLAGGTVETVRLPG